MLEWELRPLARLRLDLPQAHARSAASESLVGGDRVTLAE